jgi:hypothetical protein
MRAYEFIKLIIKARGFPHRKSEDTDFSAFTTGTPPTRKQLLLEKCRKQDVSIYVDDPTEQSAGIYAELRGVVSESELDRRLNAKKVIVLSKRTNVIAYGSLLVSAITLVISFL